MTEPGKTTAPAFSNYLVLVLLALIVFGLYGYNLNGFWRGDDTSILLHALRHSPLEMFISPAAWQELSSANLTPLVSLSFSLDYWIAGLNPRAFYFHQLAIICLIGFMTWLLLGRLMSKPLALGGAILVLLGTPVVTVSSQLMTRHYIEGLLLTLLSLYFYLRFQQQEKARFFLLAVLCYVLAVTAKEIYVPFGILLLILIIRKGEDVAERALPVVLVMGGYVFWRTYMLPDAVGGYADTTDMVSVSYITGALETFLTIPSIVFGGYWLVMMAIFVVALGLLLWISPELGLFIPLAAGLIMAPLLPLIAFPGITNPDRYLLLPWFAFAVALVFALGKLAAHFNAIKENRLLLPVAAGIVVCAIALMLVHQQSFRHDVEAFNAKADMQVRFFWEHDQSVALVPDNNILNNFWLLQSSRELKELVNNGATSPRAVVDDIFLDDDLPLFVYADECSCMSDISNTIPAKIAALNANRRSAVPLNLLMTNVNGLISWEFGPYTSGSYRVLSEEMGNLALPARQDNLRTNYRREVGFYLKYIAPEGWVSYSPLIKLRPDGVPVIWARE
jgi:hypothetical protein